MSKRSIGAMVSRCQWKVWPILFLAVLAAAWYLELERASVARSAVQTTEGEITIYRHETDADAPLILVSHGFAGSRQMMQYIARDLARAGFVVASFDYIGHGKTLAAMSPDVTRIEGTTRQLVTQTTNIAKALEAHGEGMPKILIGHSMATDIVVRTAAELDSVEDVIAISMYSDAVTASHPKRLLMVSGAWESRLRQVALKAVGQVQPDPSEAVTARKADVLRRAVAVPLTEHLSVLFSATTSDEIQDWLAQNYSVAKGSSVWFVAGPLLGVLVGLVLLVHPFAQLIPAHPPQTNPITFRAFAATILMPVVPAIAAGQIFGGGLFGFAGFRRLMAFLAVWGLVATVVQIRPGRRPGLPRPGAVMLYLAWGLGVFAFALDRYAAAFIPVGPRATLMIALLPATLIFMLADQMLLADVGLGRRILARLSVLISIAVPMLIWPENTALLFSVLPVFILFYIVYGFMARVVAQRAGVASAGTASGVALAWALAASTPLFAG